jgi:hypothetical protein
MLEKHKLALTYEERQALPIIRKAIKRRPELAAVLLEGMAKEAATAVMLQIRDELKVMLDVNRAFSEVAFKLAQLEKDHAQEQANQAQACDDQAAQQGSGSTTASTEA